MSFLREGVGLLVLMLLGTTTTVVALELRGRKRTTAPLVQSDDAPPEPEAEPEEDVGTMLREVLRIKDAPPEPEHVGAMLRDVLRLKDAPPELGHPKQPSAGGQPEPEDDVGTMLRGMLRIKDAPPEPESEQTTTGGSSSCEACMPVVNDAFEISCADLDCAVRAAAKVQDKIVVGNDFRHKMSDIYACIEKQKCDLTKAKATAKEVGLDLSAMMKKAEPEKAGGSSCEACMPMVNDALHTSCTDEECAVRAAVEQEDKIKGSKALQRKMKGIYACAKQHKCDLAKAKAAAEEAGADLKELEKLDGQQDNHASRAGGLGHHRHRVPMKNRQGYAP